MQFFEGEPVGIAILAGALFTSVLLGALLSSFRGRLSERTRQTRIGFLLVLSFAVGFTIYVWTFLLPLSILGNSIFRYFSPPEVFSQYFQGIAPLLAIVTISSLICGGVSMICPNKREEESGSG